MEEKYLICYEGGQGEIVEKKSRFIANVRPVREEQQAVRFIEEMKKTYWDARHNCYAWVLGDKNQKMKFSDDGEPAQTAGKPMLDILLGAGIHDTCVVVTRYFGGTLLGTGGLVRAYSQAVRAGLADCVILEKCLGCRVAVKTSYTLAGKLQHLAARRQLHVLDTVYTDAVLIELLVPSGEQAAVVSELVEATGGSAQIDISDPVYYARQGKNVIIPCH